MSNVVYTRYRGGPHLKLWEGRSAQNTDHDRRQDRDLREFRAEIGAADADRHFAYAERFSVDLPGEVDLLQDLNAWTAAAEAVEELEDFLPPIYYEMLSLNVARRDIIATLNERDRIMPPESVLMSYSMPKLRALAKMNGWAPGARASKANIVSGLIGLDSF